MQAAHARDDGAITVLASGICSQWPRCVAQRAPAVWYGRIWPPPVSTPQARVQARPFWRGVHPPLVVPVHRLLPLQSMRDSSAAFRVTHEVPSRLHTQHHVQQEDAALAGTAGLHWLSTTGMTLASPAAR